MQLPDRVHSGPLARRLLLVWAMLSALTLAFTLERLLSLELRGDDALRLVQVRDLIGGQPWFDLHQYRIDPPQGVPMHWSRLVDGPIAAVLLVLTPLLGATHAEIAAMVIVPLLTLAATIAFVGCAAARLFDLRTAGFAALTIGLLSPVLFQLQPTRLDHHGWQLAATAAAVLGLALRTRKGAWLAGMAMALGCTISLEMVPLSAAFAGYFALRWLEDSAQRWELVGYLQALAGGLILAFAIALGPNLKQYCDAIGPAYLAFFAFVALAVTAVARFPLLSPLVLGALLGVAGAGGVAIFAGLAPQCLGSPFASLDPVVRDYWYLLVLEGRPAWEQSAEVAVPPLIQIALALAATGLLATRGSGASRWFWRHYAVLLTASLVLGLITWRSMGFAGILATLPLGWFVAHVLARLERFEGLVPKLVTLAGLVLVLMPSLGFAVAERLRPEPAYVVQAGATGPLQAGAKNDCSDSRELARLNGLPRGEILSLFDRGPAILMHTHHRVTATGHHRAGPAIADALNTYLSDPEKARMVAQSRGADYLLICTDISEAEAYAQARPKGLAARLMRGETPGWLQPIAGFTKGPLRVWRIMPDGSPSPRR